MKFDFSAQIIEKHSNIKFHENPSTKSRVVPCGQTDRYDEATVAFRTKVIQNPVRSLFQYVTNGKICVKFSTQSRGSAIRAKSEAFFHTRQNTQLHPLLETTLVYSNTVTKHNVREWSGEQNQQGGQKRFACKCGGSDVAEQSFGQLLIHKSRRREENE